MMMSGKKPLISPSTQGNVPGFQTPITAKKKKKTNKEGKKGLVVLTSSSAAAAAAVLASALNHSRKLSDNRLCLLGSANSGTPERNYFDRHHSNNSPSNRSLSKKGQEIDQQAQEEWRGKRRGAIGGDGYQYEGNQDIKNKLLNLLTQKNDCKKITSSKSSGNSLDFAICEFGKRKKSPQNLVGNSYNLPQQYIPPSQQLQYFPIKKSPQGKSKNQLYFYEKPNNINSQSQIHGSSSAHYALSPKEPKNIQTILSQAHHLSKKDLHLYSQSPHLTTILKSKGLSPEQRDSLSPSQEHLRNIITLQKNLNKQAQVSSKQRSGISPANDKSMNNPNQSTTLKKKFSLGKSNVGYLIQNSESTNNLHYNYNNPSIVGNNSEQQNIGDPSSNLSKRDNSKERIINLLSQKQDPQFQLQQSQQAKDYNTRKGSTVSKKQKSQSPDNQKPSSQMKIQLEKTAKKLSPPQRPSTAANQQTKSKPAFKKIKPPDLEEVASGSAAPVHQNNFQSISNSTKSIHQPPFHTPKNIESNQQAEGQKKFYFDINSLNSNSQMINSHTVNTTSQNNQSASFVNHSNSARSNNQAGTNSQHQNYLYQFLHGSHHHLNNNPGDNYNYSASHSRHNITALNNSIKQAYYL